MYLITGEIEGLAPLLYNGWTKRSIASLKKQSGGGKLSEEQSRGEAAEKIHCNSKGLIMPKVNFKKALLAGVKLGKLQEGRSSLFLYAQATVYIQDDLQLLRGKNFITEPDGFHEEIGRNENTGQAVWTIRPIVNLPWGAQFVLSVTDDRRNSDTLRQALETGGLLNGIGSHRPEYGRFIVKNWKVLKTTEKGKKR